MEKFCSECGNKIKEKAELCPNCGVRQRGISTNKNKIAAALFAIFFGGIGAHKFYLGQVGQGIVYLLFCWTFIPTVVAFFEFIILLVMKDEEFERKYC